MRRRLLYAVPVALGCGLAFGAETGVPGWYLGAGIGRAEYGGEADGTSFDRIDEKDSPDDSQTMGRMLAGYRFGPHLGVEASYQDLGTHTLHVEGQTAGNALAVDRVAEADAYALAVLGHYTLKSGSFFGRLGAARWSVESSTAAIAAGTVQRREDDDSGTDLLWGIGYEHRIGSGTLRVGYDEISNVGIDAEEEDVRLLALDILLYF
jgi:hypothetical protein